MRIIHRLVGRSVGRSVCQPASQPEKVSQSEKVFCVIKSKYFACILEQNNIYIDSKYDFGVGVYGPTYKKEIGTMYLLCHKK